jgi:hypothetical protein
MQDLPELWPAQEVSNDGLIALQLKDENHSAISVMI